MKRIYFVIFLATMMLGGNPIQAQFSEATITFDNINHNFGNIKEENGVVEHIFKFKNTGKQALILNAVRSSCGCTVAEWSKEPIPPGESGTIKASYNPLRRPGAFRKSVTVTSNAKERTKVLYIVGLVEPKPKTMEDEYPVKMGSIRMSSNNLSVLSVKNTEKKTASINVLNTADHDVKVTIPEPPAHLKFSVQPETLQPKQKGIIQVEFDATKVNDWGFTNSWVYLYLNGEKFKGNRLAAGGTIVEDFSHLTPTQRANAARAVFPEESFNFGSIKQGEKVEHVFSFQNTGKEKLIIRKIKTNCGCTAGIPSSKEIAPGESGNFRVTFDSARRVGKQLQQITIITNDPVKSTIKLRLAGTIAVPGK